MGMDAAHARPTRPVVSSVRAVFDFEQCMDRNWEAAKAAGTVRARGTPDVACREQGGSCRWIIQPMEEAHVECSATIRQVSALSALLLPAGRLTPFVTRHSIAAGASGGQERPSEAPPAEAEAPKADPPSSES
jgi:hypothetical protein